MIEALEDVCRDSAMPPQNLSHQLTSRREEAPGTIQAHEPMSLRVNAIAASSLLEAWAT